MLLIKSHNIDLKGPTSSPTCLNYFATAVSTHALVADLTMIYCMLRTSKYKTCDPWSNETLPRTEIKK